MSRNRLNELAQLNVPPPPRDISRQVHRRLNTWLLAQHLADLIFRGLPYAFFHFLRMVLAGVTFGLAGKDSGDSKNGDSKK